MQHHLVLRIDIHHMKWEVLNNLFTRVSLLVALNGRWTAMFLSMVAVVRQMTIMRSLWMWRVHSENFNFRDAIKSIAVVWFISTSVGVE